MPSYTPMHWVPFLLPPMTYRATVEVFRSASTWAYSIRIVGHAILYAVDVMSKESLVCMCIPSIPYTAALEIFRARKAMP
jgi:hypothetical protein